MKKLTLGFSPCPNDTFIFDAIVNNKIDLEGISFEPIIEDVQTLNDKAFENELDITKLSFYAFSKLQEDYRLLDSGSALGNNCGPLLIAATAYSSSQINNLRIAVPGKYTTAHFLFCMAFPEANNKTEMIFSEIEGAILDGHVDAGVIIHENRFTYQSKGLIKIIDLGEYWETKTGLPIPLGCIAAGKNFSDEMHQKINRVIRRSVEYAFANPDSSKMFIKKYSQELQHEVIQKHIDLYVNNYTIDLGERGRKAVEKFLQIASVKLVSL